MKVYELSKRFNLSNNDMIKVIKNLEIQAEKGVNSFTSLTTKEIRVVERHLELKQKTKKKPVSKKSQAPQEHGKVLIVKKGEKENYKEKQVKKVHLKSKVENEKIPEKTIEKELPLAPRKVGC